MRVAVSTAVPTTRPPARKAHGTSRRSHPPLSPLRTSASREEGTSMAGFFVLEGTAAEEIKGEGGE